MSKQIIVETDELESSVYMFQNQKHHVSLLLMQEATMMQRLNLIYVSSNIGQIGKSL